MRVTAKIDQCIASGECVLACGKVFAQRDDGTVRVLLADPPSALREQVEDAVAACPAGVLEIISEPGDA